MGGANGTSMRHEARQRRMTGIALQRRGGGSGSIVAKLALFKL